MSSNDAAHAARRRAAIMAAVALYLQETAPDNERDAGPKEPVMAARPMAEPPTGPTASLNAWKTAGWGRMRGRVSRKMDRSAWKGR